MIILDAADAEMRGLAIRRGDQSQFLAAWGAEMIRVHLHQIEKTEIDTAALRKAILAAAGGIPSGTVKLIREMGGAQDPLEIARGWQVSERFDPAIVGGTLGRALVLLEDAEGDDYQASEDLVREYTGCDLETVGPELLATGLVASWRPEARRIRRSALGDLVSRTIEE